MIKFFRDLDSARAWESLKLCFAILGGSGFAGYIASMKIWMAVFTISLSSATWYMIYRMTERNI